MDLLTSFQTKLKNTQTDTRDIVRSELIYGHPHVYADKPDIYYHLKSEVARFFKVHPHNVIMVGSAKLGFSISPEKLWRPFGSESDIDIVIVSEKAFTEYWNKLFLFNTNISRSEREEANFTKFKNYFFQGWIRPDCFNFQYAGKSEWFDFFSQLSRTYGQTRKISGALYYNFDFFEQYHKNNLTNLRKMETLK